MDGTDLRRVPFRRKGKTPWVFLVRVCCDMIFLVRSTWYLYSDSCDSHFCFVGCGWYFCFENLKFF